MRRSISRTAPGIHSAYRRRCIAPGEFIPAANNPVNRSFWRLAWKVRRPAAGFFIALFPRPRGGTTLLQHAFLPVARTSSGVVRRAWLSHAAARHDGPAMDTRDDLVFDALTRGLAASAAR